MYSNLRNKIAEGNYQLADMQYRVKKFYALGDLNEEQLDELLSLSQENATADAERPETLTLLQELAARVTALENKLTTQGDSETDQTDYEKWTAWDGISNKYQYGAIVTHNDKLWESVFNGQNVWEPGTVGTENLWVVYTPETTE